LRTTIGLGAAGVPVFFVISGIVIGLTRPDMAAGTFLRRRLIRIVPLYWIATLVFTHQSDTLADYLHSFSFVPDFSKPRWYPIYTAGWSLSYEMAFYLMFAAMLALAGRRARVCMLLLLLVLGPMHIAAPFSGGALLGTARLPEFAGGLGLALAWQAGWRPGVRLGLAAIALGLAIFSLTPWEPPLALSYRWAIPAFLVTFGVLGLEGQAWLRHPALVLAGDASYAIYLFHLTALEGVTVLDRHFGWGIVDGNIWGREALLLPAAVAFGVVGHIVIEKPLLAVLRRRRVVG